MKASYVKVFLVWVLSCCSFLVMGQTSVNPATGGMNLCVGNAGYTTLGNIVISEGANGDFVIDPANRTYVITVPTNFQFNPGTGSVNTAAPDNFNGAVGMVVTATTITLNYIVDGNDRLDVITISGIQVRAITAPSFGNIRRTGGDALQMGNTVGDNRNHGTLFSLSPPTVSIGDDDADNTVCTSVTNNITFTGYGATSYQFFVDGAPAGGGSTLNYNWTNTVGSPHSIYVVGTSNGCSVQSSTLNIVVNETPSINWVPGDPSFALTDGNNVLNTNGSFSENPGGGSFSFSGTGVSPSGLNYVFSPAAAGAGSFPITATYTRFGCSTSNNRNFTVSTANAITGLNASYCIYDGSDWVSIDPTPKSVAYYQYYDWSFGYTNIPGFGYNSSTGYSFVPNYFSTMVNGMSSTTYGYVYLRVAYTDGTYSPAAFTYVYPRPIVNLFPVGGTNQLCNNGSPIPLLLSPIDNGLAQTFVTGTGVSEIPGGSGDWFLNPSVGGTGVRNITFNYRENGGGGCENSDVEIVTVNPPPTATISNVFDPVGYCTNSAAFALTGTPLGGTFSGPGTFFNTFYPYYNTVIGSNTITYTYTDANGCSDTETEDIDIFNAATVSIPLINSDTSYCLPLTGNGTYTLRANRQGPATDVVWQGYDGSTYGSGGNWGTFNPVAPFGGYNEAVDYTTSNTQQTLEYTYIQASTTGQPASCPAGYAYATVFLIPKPVITITGLVKDEYCTAEPNISLTGGSIYQFPDYGSFPQSSGAGAVTSFESVPPGDAALVGSVFQPSSAAAGPHVIRYNFTDINNCSHFKDTTITINENPVADFVVDSGRCATAATYFNSSLSVVPPSTTVDFRWDFGDGTSLGDTSHLEDPSYTYSFPGGYPVSLTLLTNQGCSDTKALTGANLLTIQSIPVSNYDYRFQCLGDATIFDTLSIVQLGAFKSRTWIMADINNNPFDSIYQTTSNVATTYSFANAGKYRVTVVDSTTLGCTDRRRKPVFILPYVTPTTSSPYAISFKDSTGNWGENGINSSWVHDIPNPLRKTQMYYGGLGITDSVWVTNAADTAYNSGEKSHLHSPCFNFSQLEKPMIAIKLWTVTQEQIAGAVLNVSVNDGATWSTIGQLGDGVEWYNTIGIAGSPGTLSTNDGWSGVDEDWRIAKIGLPLLGSYNPAQKIRFKITFGAPSDTAIARSEGIAIDSVWIGNKNKVVLMEHFTNYNTAAGTTTPAITTADNAMNSVRDLRKNDMAAIYYHTSFPALDDYNTTYSAGPSARVLYYGVSSSPRTVLDGDFYNGNIYTGGTSETRLDIKDVDARSLETAIFNMELSNDFSAGAALIGTKITYIGQNPFTKDIIVHTVITEDDSSGAVKYASVARQMLPDASGAYISKSWVTNDEYILSNTWSHSLSPSAVLGAVSFIQDASTKEIYQAVYHRGNGFNGNPFVTGLEEEKEEEFEVRMFPNPATDEVFFLFGKALRQNSYWELYDNLGKKVGNGTCNSGKEGFSINLSNYTGGVYHVKLIGENGQVDFKELVVIH